MDRQLLKGSTEMLILATLAEGPKHGYLITQSLRDHSDDQFQFSAGMLYPLLHKLESKGWIQGSWEQTDGGRKRKFYDLTKKGRAHLADKKKEWESFTGFVSGVIHG